MLGVLLVGIVFSTSDTVLVQTSVGLREIRLLPVPSSVRLGVPFEVAFDAKSSPPPPPASAPTKVTFDGSWVALDVPSASTKLLPPIATFISEDEKEDSWPGQLSSNALSVTVTACTSLGTTANNNNRTIGPGGLSATSSAASDPQPPTQPDFDAHRYDTELLRLQNPRTVPKGRYEFGGRRFAYRASVQPGSRVRRRHVTSSTCISLAPAARPRPQLCAMYQDALDADGLPRYFAVANHLPTDFLPAFRVSKTAEQGVATEANGGGSNVGDGGMQFPSRFVVTIRSGFTSGGRTGGGMARLLYQNTTAATAAAAGTMSATQIATSSPSTMSVATSMPYGAVRLLWQRDRRMRLSWSRALVTSEWHSARADAAHHECPEWECYYTLYARWHVPVRRGNLSSPLSFGAQVPSASCIGRVRYVRGVPALDPTGAGAGAGAGAGWDRGGDSVFVALSHTSGTVAEVEVPQYEANYTFVVVASVLMSPLTDALRPGEFTLNWPAVERARAAQVAAQSSHSPSSLPPPSPLRPMQTPHMRELRQLFAGALPWTALATSGKVVDAEEYDPIYVHVSAVAPSGPLDLVLLGAVCGVVGCFALALICSRVYWARRAKAAGSRVGLDLGQEDDAAAVWVKAAARCRRAMLLVKGHAAGFAHDLGCKRCALTLVGNTSASQSTTPAADSDSAVTVAMTPMDTSADTFNAQWAADVDAGSGLRPRVVPTSIANARGTVAKLAQRATAWIRRPGFRTSTNSHSQTSRAQKSQGPEAGRDTTPTPMSAGSGSAGDADDTDDSGDNDLEVDADGNERTGPWLRAPAHTEPVKAMGPTKTSAPRKLGLTLSLPADGITTNAGGITTYAVEIELDAEERQTNSKHGKWVLHKTWSEFSALRTALGADGLGIPFPGQPFAKLTAEELDARRTQLEAYLHGVVEKYGSFADAEGSERALRAFTRKDQHDSNASVVAAMSPASTSISI